MSAELLSSNSISSLLRHHVAGKRCLSSSREALALEPPSGVLARLPSTFGAEVLGK
jgi:hypothetical protein